MTKAKVTFVMESELKQQLAEACANIGLSMNRALNTLVRKTLRADPNLYELDYDAITIHGQTAGEWISLGEYDLRADTPAYVEFDNGGDVSGTLYADAVLVVPKK